MTCQCGEIVITRPVGASGGRAYLCACRRAAGYLGPPSLMDADRLVREEQRIEQAFVEWHAEHPDGQIAPSKEQPQ